jgi:hypothetical protein
MSNVRIVQLVSGEVVIAQVDFTRDGHIGLKQAFQVVLSPGASPSQLSIAFLPWMPTLVSAQEPYKLNNTAIAAINEPSADAAKMYGQQTGSVVLAPAGAIPTTPRPPFAL